MVIVGNKIDLVHEGQEREVSKVEATNFATLESLNYYETSAKTGEGIQPLMDDIIDQAYQFNQSFKTAEEPEEESDEDPQ